MVVVQARAAPLRLDAYAGVNFLMETSNSQPGAATLYAPLAQNNNNGIYSGLTLSQQNSGSFSIVYYPRNAGGSSVRRKVVRPIPL